jgi:phosphoribosylformylglycinamidine synthase
MAFAARTGIDIQLDAPVGQALIGELFNEELGVVVQVAAADVAAFKNLLAEFGLGDCLRRVGQLNNSAEIRIYSAGKLQFSATRASLQQTWSEVSYRMQAARDNPATAREQFDAITDDSDPGLSPLLSFDPAADITAPMIARGLRPRVAVLREQGVNSQNEMAAALYRAGFEPVDLHMSDILEQRRDLAGFRGLVACGGFSFGDVLGAGGGWAKSILFHSAVRDQFQVFFERPDTFALGVCNGCQMLAELREIIPGTEYWPRFVRNLSEQFEARLSLVEILDSPSILLAGMTGSVLPIVTSHGEGRAEFAGQKIAKLFTAASQVPLQYVDNYHQPAIQYPANPNGSPGGIAGMCNADGRVTGFMPHPERVHRTVQHSWHPANWGEDGPWLRLFRNARVWVG